MSTSSRYYVGSVVCIENELPRIQSALQSFTEIQGAVTYSDGKARYCLDLGEINAEEAKALIEKVRNVVEFALMKKRSTKF